MALAPIPVTVACHHPSPPKAKAITNNRRLNLETAISSLTSCDPKAHDRDFYNSLVSLCVSERALDEGNRLRDHFKSTGHLPGIFVDNQFLNLYMKCGQVESARQMFDEMPYRNVVSWNAMISGYCSNGYPMEALRVFVDMVEEGASPTTPTYLGVLQACTGVGDMDCGGGVHAHIIKAGFFDDVQVANSLISMYSRFGVLYDAMMVFHKMVTRDVVTWNSIISAYAQDDEAIVLFVKMLEEGFHPNEFTFGSLVRSRDGDCVKELHAMITKYGLDNQVYIGCALVNAYRSCGLPEEACQVFMEMPERNVVAWNSVIAACVENGMICEGIRYFLQMWHCGILPDLFTISTILKVSATELALAESMQFHGLAIKLNFCEDALVGNTLIAMYSKHGLVLESLQAFRSLLEPDIVSWNSLMQCYIKKERYEEALALFLNMNSLGIACDEFSIVGALTACTSLGWAGTGKQVHGLFLKSGEGLNEFVGSSLINMYAESASIDDAKITFDKIENKDLIAWNSMLIAFAQNHCLNQVMLLLSTMREENFEPDIFTFTGILSGCADASTIHIGRQVHALLLKSELAVDAAVSNSLITMYSSCGNITEAEVVFSKLDDKNLVSWTAMLGGYARTGCSLKAVALFDEMERSGVRPNSKTLLSLLTACSYTGMMSEAKKYFSSMEVKYSIRPEFEHYACMVDALSRAGRLEEAEYLINNMPYEANALVWQMLLSACRIHGDLDRGRRSMEKIIFLDPGDSGAYILLSNLYASLGRWDEVEEVRELMRENKVRKEPGKSWIEVHERVHEFRAGDCSHLQTEEIYLTLTELTNVMLDVN